MITDEAVEAGLDAMFKGRFETDAEVKIRSVLEAALPHMGWRDIESAPKDGTLQICCFECKDSGVRVMTIASFSRHYEQWNSDDHGLIKPFAYLPIEALPAPPSTD